MHRKPHAGYGIPGIGDPSRAEVWTHQTSAIPPEENLLRLVPGLLKDKVERGPGAHGARTAITSRIT